MTSPLALIWDLIAKDSASPAFLKVASAADKAATSTERAQAKLAGAEASMTKFGATLSKSVTLPLVGLAAVSVDQAAKFQKAMNTVAVATDKTRAQTAAAPKGLESIAVSTGTSLSQLSASFYTASKAGQSVAQALATTKAAAQGAKAEGADLGTVTDALTSIMASYGKALSNPVAAMNEIVRGAGLAKTTVQDFASSLSNVVPLASSLHISFSQVAGALDTLTQHGETAQRATDNLSNLITNLAGSNNVASKALGQLGVNSVTLSKQLASPNGLSAALNTVLAAIAAHGKDGMIVTSAFKQAQLATQSLHTELGAMTGTLKTNSEAFVNGTMSYKDYYSYTKSLGGQQFALAKNLITTNAAANGFNTTLVSGNSTVKTLAGSLKTALGGMTGMRTALMLSGASATTFKNSADAVAKAAQHAGADVLGWDTTQGTLTTKMDQAKENLQVLAVEIGNTLIPAVSKLVGWVREGVTWFEGLSSGTKRYIGFAALAAAALGPLLLVGGKLLAVFRLLAAANTLVWTGGAKVVAAFRGIGSSAGAASEAVSTAEATQTTALEAGVAAQIAALDRLAAAFAGTANSSALNLARMRANVARNSEANVAALGGQAAATEESAAASRFGGLRAGGAGSFAAGAGALIGGQLLGGVISGGSKSGSGRNIAGTAVADAGIGAALGSFAGPEGLLIGAALGAGVGALTSWIKGMHALTAGEKDYAAVTKNATSTLSSFASALEKGGPGLATNQKNAALAAIAHTSLAEQAAKAGLTVTDLSNAITGNDAAFEKLVNAWQASGKPAQATLDSLLALHNQFGQATVAARAYADSQAQLLPTETQVGTVADLLKGKLGEVAGAGTTASEWATSFRSGLDQLSASVRANGATLDANTSFGMKNIAALRQAAAEALAHAQAVYNQTGSLKAANNALESDRAALMRTAEQAGLSAAAATKVADSILGIPTNHNSKITVSTPGVQRALSDVSSLYSLLHSIEHPVNVPVNVYQKSGGPLGGLLGASHAKGGSVADGWFTAGEQGYELGYKSGSNVQFFSHAESQAMTGLSRVPGYAGGTVGGIRYSTDLGYQNALARASSAMGKALAAFTAVVAKSSSTADQLQTAITNLIAAAKKNGESSSALAKVTKDQATLVATATQRDAMLTNLNNARTAFNNEASTVSNAVKQLFNITSEGSATGPNGTYNFLGPVAVQSTLADQQAAISKASIWARQLAIVEKGLGNSPAAKELIQQLAEAGPATSGAEVAALSGASKAQLAQLVAGQAKLDAISNVAGQGAANSIEGQQLKVLETGFATVTSHIDKLAAGIAAELNGLARNSRTVGASKPAGR